MKRYRGIAIGLLGVLLAVAAAPTAQAGLFGETEAEKETRLAKHVADVLREPNKLIAQAQEAAEADDVEEAIRLFRQAQEAIEKVERAEDTTGAAWATMRLKKFLCISSLDALALKRANVQDNRQAVTDTSDLEERLAKERAALAAKEQEAAAKQAPEVPDHPPTLAEQLVTERQGVAAAAEGVKQAEEALAAATQALEEKQAAFTEAAQAHAAADAAAFVAKQAFVQAKANPSATAEARANAQKAREDAVGALTKAKLALGAARKARDQATIQRAVAEQAVQKAQEAQRLAQMNVGVLERAIAQEQADARAAQAAEQKRLEAESLAKKQAAAAEAAKAREAAARQARKQGDAQARAEAEADDKARKHEIAWCNEMWRNKRVDELEPRLVEALGKWPEEPALLILLARLRLIQGRTDDALELAEEIPPTGAVGRQARLVAAGVYLTKNRPMESMKVLEELMKESPKDPTPYFNMAVTLLRLPEIDPKRDLAAKYYAKSVSLGGRRSSVLERRLNME